jgi:hypothetical protein
MKRNLTEKEEIRVTRCIQDKIQHFSITISPAPKDVANNEIESIKFALEYYAEKEICEVIIQPKFMGSYVDIYLHRDIEDSNFFSRNAFLISDRLIEHTNLVIAAKPVWDRFKDEWEAGAELIIVQAELMPWAALGKGLIEKDFTGHKLCHQSYHDYLKTSSLPKTLSKLMSSDDFKNYLKKHQEFGEFEIKKLYPQHIIRQYEALRYLNLPHLPSYQKDIDLYSKQLDLYGLDNNICFQPFNWLKIVYEDKECINDNNISGFKKVSDQPYLIVNTKDLNDSEIKKAYDFFYQLTTSGMEGVVIKPNLSSNEDIAPMLKVRGNDYLQLIYGVDFRNNFEKHLNKRKTGLKMKCSINEAKISRRLLRIPSTEIGYQNKDYRELITTRILEEDLGKDLDFRL